MFYEHRLYREDLALLTEEGISWEKLKGRNILVAGASGLIGTFLVDVLMRRNELFHDGIGICALARDRGRLEARFGRYGADRGLRVEAGDVSAGFRQEGRAYDYVIHAAGNTHPREYAGDPVGTVRAHVFGAYRLLEYAGRNRGCRAVLLSSVEVYGENRGDAARFDEGYCGHIDCNTLRAGYPESKRLSEAMLQAYIAQYGADGVVLRLARTYGPTASPDDSKAMSQFIRRAASGEDVVLKSAGGQTYSYSYVADAVAAVLRCMTDGACGEAYNVADEASDISLRDAAEYLAEIAGTRVVYGPPEEGERRGYSTAATALMDAGKIRGLGWRARYPIREGLARTVSILRDEGYL